MAININDITRVIARVPFDEMILCLTMRVVTKAIGELGERKYEKLEKYDTMVWAQGRWFIILQAHDIHAITKLLWLLEQPFLGHAFAS